LPLSDEGSGQHNRGTCDLERATRLVKDDYGQCKCHNDIELDHRPSQVRPCGLIAFVVAVSAEDEVKYTDARHPQHGGRRELAKMGYLAGDGGDQEKAEHTNWHRERHPLGWCASHNRAPSSGVVEGKARRRKDG
jgi:hypothetical protein